MKQRTGGLFPTRLEETSSLLISSVPAAGDITKHHRLSLASFFQKADVQCFEWRPCSVKFVLRRSSVTVPEEGAAGGDVGANTCFSVFTTAGWEEGLSLQPSAVVLAVCSRCCDSRDCSALSAEETTEDDHCSLLTDWMTNRKWVTDSFYNENKTGRTPKFPSAEELVRYFCSIFS